MGWTHFQRTICVDILFNIILVTRPIRVLYDEVKTHRLQKCIEYCCNWDVACHNGLILLQAVDSTHLVKTVIKHIIMMTK